MQNSSGRSVGPLQIAFSHVNRAWLPLGVESGQFIKDQIIHNRFKKDEALLRKAIKTDISLFTYCVRELVNSDTAKPGSWPHDAVGEQSLEQLAKLVNVAPQKLEFHAAAHGTGAQQHLLTGPIIASVFAETIAPKMDIDRDKAFSCGIFRQLGLALVAWNYPGTFNGIVRQPVTESIDRILERKLGFSPTLLGLTIARDWKLSTELRSGMGEHFEEPNAIGLALRKLCRLGEVLARANEPFYTPEGPTLAAEAADQVTSLLGPTGMQILRERIGDEFSHLLRFLPDVFTRTQSQVPDTQETKVEVTEELAELDSSIKAAEASNLSEVEALFALKEKIFPLSGYLSGCVYLLNPTENRFTPRLALGDQELAKCDAISIDAKVLSHNATRAPVFSAAAENSDVVFQSVYGILGKTLPSGLLHLKPGNFYKGRDPRNARALANQAFELLRQYIEKHLNW